jgi:hypothetical protein
MKKPKNNILKILKDKSELYLNNKKIQFCFKYKFEKEGKNTINIKFKIIF